MTQAHKPSHAKQRPWRPVADSIVLRPAADDLADLLPLLTRILRVYHRDVAAMWLSGSEPLLAGARPIDVLVTEGAAPVIRAIDGIAQGAYA